MFCFGKKVGFYLGVRLMIHSAGHVELDTASKILPSPPTSRLSRFLPLMRRSDIFTWQSPFPPTLALL